jgi:hypothetical protein
MFRLFRLGRARRPVESPCRNVCGLNESNAYCLGCFRTPREIAGWREFTPRQQRGILEQLDARRSAQGG